MTEAIETEYEKVDFLRILDYFDWPDDYSALVVSEVGTSKKEKNQSSYDAGDN